METPNNFMVCTWCSTYNHHAYIEDAMNGFCIQKTDFPFVCIIADDASTDGNQEVIRKYFESNFNLLETEETDDFVLNYGRHKTNENCYFVVLYLKYNHYSIKKARAPYVSRWYDNPKYYALCEGDDYWIDENKLQRQVEVLEKNPNCTLVISNGLCGKTLEGSKLINPYNDRKTGFVDMHTLLMSVNGLVPTASMCYRNTLPQYPAFFSKSLKIGVGDKPLRIWCALHGDVFYFSDAQAFYRISGGASFGQRVSKNPAYAKKVYEGFCAFLDDLNEYTSYKYEYEIKFMKAKEEFYYLDRIKSRRIINCDYLKYPENKNKYGLKKYFIWLFPNLSSLLIKIRSKFI